MSKKLTTEEFIEEATTVHGDRYDYSLVDYKTTMIKINIICKEHGIFEQIPNNHLRGANCEKCARKNKFYWNDDRIRVEASKFTTRSEFKKNRNVAWKLAQKIGSIFLNDICKHMKYVRIYWTNEMLLREALKYNTRTEFCRGNGSAYNLTLIRGIQEEVWRQRVLRDDRQHRRQCRQTHGKAQRVAHRRQDAGGFPQ